jgi:two-component system, sensor histidine kinase and response regulator
VEPDLSISRAAARASAQGADILVVDDTPANLQLLSGMLKEAGHRVRVVPSGTLALTSAANRVPDLILLDINMPDLDGYEVCRRLKANSQLSTVPVLFISALSEPLDKVKAFSSGGVDYVTKPFQVEEVMARVRTHLENRSLQRALEERALELEERNEALERSEKLRENLVHMIVHDMRTPLSGLLASLQFLEEEAAPSLQQESRDDLKHAASAARRLAQMIADMLDINRFEAGKLDLDVQQVSAGQLLDRSLESLAGLVKGRHLRVSVPGDLRVSGDPEVLRRVIVNLLGNALKFTPSEGRIDLAAAPLVACVRITVKDDGPGIDARYHTRIFEKFEQVNVRTEGGLPSIGLGLTFCKLAVEAHGGRIGVESSPGKGSTFWFELPNAP